MNGMKIRQHAHIPVRVAQRLPMYHRFLHELVQHGVKQISSAKLSAHMGITASQLRQDLSHFGSFGHHGYGYRVDELFKVFTMILGLTRPHDMVLVGAGHLGQAVAAYEGFPNRGFYIRAVFDSDADVVGRVVAGVRVMPAADLPERLRQQSFDVGIIAVPAEAAQKMADVLVEGGVRALWNFAPVRLRVPTTVPVEHVHLSDSLMFLAYRMHRPAQ